MNIGGTVTVVVFEPIICEAPVELPPTPIVEEIPQEEEVESRV